MRVPPLRLVISIPSSRAVARPFGKGTGLGLAFLTFVFRPRLARRGAKTRNLPGAV
jgi:hypothetical protein